MQSLAQKYAQQGYTGDIESELTLSNPIHREIYNSLNKDKQFFEELRKKATEALDSLPNAQSAARSDAKQSNKTQYSRKRRYDPYTGVDKRTKENYNGVWIDDPQEFAIVTSAITKHNSIVEAQEGALSRFGSVLVGEYYYEYKNEDKPGFYTITERIPIDERIEEIKHERERTHNNAPDDSEEGDGREHLFRPSENEKRANARNDGEFHSDQSERNSGQDNGKSDRNGRTEVKADAKFSLKPASSISEENRRLIEENETYKAVIGKLNRQIAALQKKVVDQKGVRKLAKDVRAQYGADDAIRPADRKAGGAFCFSLEKQ